MPKPPKTSSVTPRVQANPEALPTAGVLRRLAALVYDAFLLFGLLATPLLIAIATLSPRQDLHEGNVAHDLPSIAPKPVILAYMLIVIVSFYCYFWRRTGQTLGMQAWRIRVDSENGGRASWRQCCVRVAVGFVSLICAGLGYWWIWVDKQHAAWHDRASNTRVVVLPKK